MKDMTHSCALVVALLVMPAFGEHGPASAELNAEQGNILMSKVSGIVRGAFPTDLLDDPFADLSDDFDVSPLPTVAAPLVASNQPSAMDPLALAAPWTVLPGMAEHEAASFLDRHTCLYFACVFIAEFLFVFSAAGCLQWRRADALEKSRQSSRKVERRTKRRKNDAHDVWGCTALHLAASTADMRGAEVLLKSGSDVNAREAWEETPLHFAARIGSLDVCELLLQHGAAVNALNSGDETPLLGAGRAGKEAVCTLLLDYGAHVGGIEDTDMPMLLSSLVMQRVFNQSVRVEAS